MHEPRLSVHGLLDPGGIEVGWLLGNPIDLESETLISGSVQTPLRHDAGAVGRDFQDWLYQFGGRFAAIVLQPQQVLFPDGGATLPVVFDRELQCAASSPFLLCRPDSTFPESPLVDVMAVFETGNYFLLESTPHARANLLLPNHALDLGRWEQSRTWPTGPFEGDDVQSLVERVATILERTLTAVAKAGHPNMSLTAGRDSRTFLACSREVLDRMRFFTVALPDDQGTTDLATAPRLAERYGLDYRVLPWLEPSKADLELFMYRTGCFVGERRGRTATRSYDQLGGNEVYVSGVASPATNWALRRSDDPNLRLRAEDLLSRTGCPPHPEMIRRARDWLAGVPEGLSGLDILALFYYEMRGGAWGGMLTMAYPEAYSFALYPYTHRSITDTEFRFPWEYRRCERIYRDLIATRWKELLGVPFNRAPARVALRKGARRYKKLAEAGLSWKSWNNLSHRAWDRWRGFR
jgi:hypothetical protein